jgi:hypothetical protein
MLKSINLFISENSIGNMEDEIKGTLEEAKWRWEKG